jgi:purine-nucleoside phosphorylase
MMTKIKEATAYIRHIIDVKPQVGIVLGSGLGSFTKELQIEKEIPYADIPHFPVSTVEGHSGKLIFAELRISELFLTIFVSDSRRSGALVK